MATLYIWMPNDNNIGHCALQLSDGTYISFWPNVSYGINDYLMGNSVPSSNASNYDEDYKSENNRPANQYKLPGLNEQLVKQYWNQHHGDNYMINSADCSTMVENALRHADYKNTAAYNAIRDFRLSVADKASNGTMTKKVRKKI
ncbi:uncharacterized protein LOC128960049 [Oppia nitens]|uniref:uncharacterized protein LOC128960049 n=1 Tax=Oppia nitens TaxID=1686743 RepID=UPI0023DB548A|nr:uncharacterized protein LOC128960049 [Oppia nitens]